MSVKAPCYERTMNTLKWFVIFALLGYGCIVALLYVTQRAMQYFPERFRTAPAVAGLPEAEEVVLDTADGERVIVWHVPPRADKPVGHLILQSPFTSAADVGAQRYWFVPVGLLMKDQFRSDLRIGKVTAPVLVLHGDRDNIVPMALAERLYGLINAPKRFVRFAGIGHNDLGAEAVEAAKQFLG